jgi:hypothetical protein
MAKEWELPSLITCQVTSVMSDFNARRDLPDFVCPAVKRQQAVFTIETRRDLIRDNLNPQYRTAQKSLKTLKSELKFHSVDKDNATVVYTLELDPRPILRIGLS